MGKSTKFPQSEQKSLIFGIFINKYLDFKDWCKIVELSNNPRMGKNEIIQECNKLKSQKNNNRKLFTKHFEKKFKDNKHPISIIEMRKVHDTFDKNIEQLKSQFFNHY